MKHTKGPWHADVRLSGSENDRGWRVGGDDGTFVADVSPIIKNDRGDASEEGKANASLIAAAPDLLEACKGLLKFFDEQFPMGWGSDPALKAHDAIAKAELSSAA